jgi:hypothetical protein
MPMATELIGVDEIGPISVKKAAEKVVALKPVGVSKTTCLKYARRFRMNRALMSLNAKLAPE